MSDLVPRHDSGSIRDLLESLLHQEPAIDQQFFVVVGEAGSVSVHVHAYDDVQGVVERVSPYVDTETYVFVFCGQRCPIFAGAPWVLRVPQGDMPLQIAATEREVDDGLMKIAPATLEQAADRNAADINDDDDEDTSDDTVPPLGVVPDDAV